MEVTIVRYNRRRMYMKAKKNIKERKKFDKRRFIFHHIEIKENRGTSKKTLSSFQSQKEEKRKRMSFTKERNHTQNVRDVK